MRSGEISRRAFLLVSTSLLAVAAPGVALAADPVGEVLARIERARAPVRTLQGPFVQTRTIGLLATDVRSTGTLTLVRPDRLRWDLDAPDDVTFWIGPEGLAYASPRGQARLPAATARLGAALDDLRAVLGGDLTRLRARWDMRIVRDDASGVEIDATPRPDATALLKDMRFALAPDLIRPTRALLVEGPRDRTVIELGPLVVDAPVEDARMRPPRR